MIMSEIGSYSLNTQKQCRMVNPQSILRDIVMTILLIWLVCPYQIFFENWYLYGFLWGLWIISAFIADPAAFNYMVFSKYTLVAISWPISIFILSLMNWAKFSPYQFTIVLVNSSFTYYAKGNYIKSLRLFVFVYLLYAIVISVFSIYQLQLNPEISRLLANSDKSITRKYAGPFMANFSFVNGVTLISLFLVFSFKVSRRKRTRVFSLLLIALAVFLLIRAQYSIALLLFFIFASIIVLFYSRGKNNNIKTVLIVFGVALIIPFAGIILQGIAELIPPGYVERRIRSLGIMLGLGGIQEGSDLAERLNLYQLSLSTFFENFFVGVGGKYYGASGLVGGHSQILDNFAYYGILFGTQFIWYLVCSFKNGSVFLKNDFKRIYKMIFIIYIIQCLLNTSYNEEMLFTIFFIVPALIYLAQYDRTKVETETETKS